MALELHLLVEKAELGSSESSNDIKTNLESLEGALEYDVYWVSRVDQFSLHILIDILNYDDHVIIITGEYNDCVFSRKKSDYGLLVSTWGFKSFKKYDVCC